MKRLILLLQLLFLAIYSYGQMKVTSENVNLRTSPEIVNNIVCKIPKGKVVSIVNDSIKYENWTKVNFNGRIGYVYSSYIKDVSIGSKNDYNNSSQSSEVKYYRNSKGEKVQSPTYYNSAPEQLNLETV
jgi:uncharacterized protein YraI